MIAFWDNVDIGPENKCWDWLPSKKNGQLLIRTATGNLIAYREAWRIHNKAAIPSGMHVLHSCDNRRCCNPHHLRLGTHKENMSDMSLRKRNIRGSRIHGNAHRNAKLNPRLVLEIRASSKSAYSMARVLGVTKRTVLMARNRHTWKSVTDYGRSSPITADDIFLSKIVLDDVTGCRNWTGPVNDMGYGVTTARGIFVFAHRLAYQLASGSPIPHGLIIMHTCNNRMCCNPEHLKIGTKKENSAQMVLDGRATDGSNQYVTKGTRKCTTDYCIHRSS